MRIIEVEIIGTYTCQICGVWFESQDDLVIIQFQEPLCLKCSVIKTLSAYEQKDLDFLKKYFIIGFCPNISKDLLIINITERFLKNDLSNIKGVDKKT